MRSLRAFLCLIVITISVLLATQAYRMRLRQRHPYSRLYDKQTEEEALDFVWRNKEKIDPFKDKVTDRVNLRIKELSGGNTNFNYVVHCVGEDNKRQGSVFIKHAKAYAKGFGEDAPMSTERLRFEFEGINEFSAFGFTTLDPYVYDSEENYLVTQFLSDYDPFISSLQNGEVDEEVAEACGAVMGNCHAGTHIRSVPSTLSENYRDKYKNTEHFELWNEHFFPMSVTRLKDSSLFKQTDDVANFGDKHYARVRDYIDNIVGKDGKEELIEAIEKVWDIYMNKKTTLIHADLHCNNIMIRMDTFKPNRVRYVIGQSPEERVREEEERMANSMSCDLTKVRMIDFEKFAYGPPGIDIGQFLTNYIYFMPVATQLPNTEWEQETLINLRPAPLYAEFENAIRETWRSYVEAFDVHMELQVKEYDISITRKEKDAIIQDNLQDAFGFIGWWLFSLVASCPVDVMPITRPLVRATQQTSPLPVHRARMLHLKIAIAVLKRFNSGKGFSNIETEDPSFWIEELISLVKKEMFQNL